MTVEYGLLLFVFGMFITNTGLLIAWYVVNESIKNKKKEEEKKLDKNNPLKDLLDRR